ncbi:hypothetical protein CASFOL_023561 [Castilleja foliolosa]|uniref:AP2/ERF domain-containing protein n=1 Tax=Castilleja foliolosa TaxID=1961234 RepID=A0ABD3CM85_9LAMI
MGSVSGDGKNNGGGGALRSLVRRKQVDSANKESYSSSSGSGHHKLAKALTVPHLIAIGGYDKEEKAARAYDMAALKYWGTSTTTNFPISNYEKEIEDMKHMTRQEFVASIGRDTK